MTALRTTNVTPMQFILAGTGLTPGAQQRLRQRLDELPVPPREVCRTPDGRLLFATSPGSVIDVAHDGGRHVARVGSGVDLLADRAAPLGVDGTAPDTAAIGLDVDDEGLLAVAGPGTQELFVAELDDGGFLVGSNLWIVAQCAHGAPRVDRSYEDFLLGFGFLPDDRTVYRGVRVLRGTTEQLGASAPARAPVGTPRSVVDHEPESFDEAVEHLYDLFLSTIEELAAGHRHHAVLLGGLDSALVVAGLRRLGHEVTTYTFSFGDPRYEQRNVGVVTRELGTQERWVRITPEVVLAGLDRFAQVFALPSPQPHYQLHTLHAARQISADGFDRVLTGDGCDAVFLGYPTVSTRARLIERLGRVPAPVVRGGLAAASLTPVDRRLGHVARMARSTLLNLELEMPARGHLPTRYLDQVALRRLRSGPPPVQDESIEQIRHRLAAPHGDLDPVRLAFHGNALTGQSRSKVQGAVAATGVAQFSPFTRGPLASFVAALPVEYLRPPGSPAGASGKALLLEMVRRHALLPPSVIDMPKQSPSDSPVDGWYSGELRHHLLDLLEDLPFSWNPAYVEELLRPKLAEDLYRRRISISHHAFQVIGLLASYASFSRT